MSAKNQVLPPIVDHQAWRAALDAEIARAYGQSADALFGTEPAHRSRSVEDFTR